MALTRKDILGNSSKLNCGPTSKPCGNACIPKDKKCRASWNKPVKAAATVAAVAGAGLVGTAVFHKRGEMRRAARGLVEPALQVGFGLGNAARGNVAGATKNLMNVTETAREVPSHIRTLKTGYGKDLNALKQKAKRAYFKAKHHRPAAKRRDSIWAEGFAP